MNRNGGPSTIRPRRIAVFAGAWRWIVRFVLVLGVVTGIGSTIVDGPPILIGPLVGAVVLAAALIMTERARVDVSAEGIVFVPFVLGRARSYHWDAIDQVVVDRQLVPGRPLALLPVVAVDVRTPLGDRRIRLTPTIRLAPRAVAAICAELSADLETARRGPP